MGGKAQNQPQYSLLDSIGEETDGLSGFWGTIWGLVKQPRRLSGSNFCGVRHAHVPNDAARGRAGSSILEILSLFLLPVQSIIGLAHNCV